jgi:hypothetical protein
MASAKVPTDGVPSKKPRTESDLSALPVDSWLCVEDLFGSIPELAELFEEVFEGKPRWVQPTLDKDSQWAIPMTGFARTEQTRTYSIFIDGSGRLDANDIASFPGPITQIEEMASSDQSRRFRAAVDHVGKNMWWEALTLHSSPYVRGALIKPVYGVISEYRMISVILLYALSIVVRYRPSLWRRVQEGDLDHMRAIIEAFLTIVERVLPEEFLEKVLNQKVHARQPFGY